MTVQSTAVQSTQVANGVVETFTYQFKLLTAAGLLVQVEDLLGVFHTLALNSDYTVDPLGIGLDAGGNILNVTYLGLVIPNGYTVYMTRVTAITQGVDLANQGTYLPEEVEGGLDTGITIQQENAFALARSIRVALTDAALNILPAAALRLGMFLQFDPVLGQPIAVPGQPAVFLNNYTATVPPVAGNDSSQGYSEGSLWFDVVHKIAYICVTATLGAAVWQALFVQNNLTAVVNPVVTNDSSQGYAVGSMWLNTLTNSLYVCLKNSVGAAVWVIVGGLSTLKNFFTDPGCRIAQIGTAGGGPNVTTGYQYGDVDLVQMKVTGTLVSAGTCAQAGSVPGTSTGFAAAVANLTVTGAGVVFMRRWLEAADAEALQGGSTGTGNTCTFGVLVRHSAAGAVNFNITLNYANSPNNFAGGVTNIITSANVSVPAGTGMTLLTISATLPVGAQGGIEMIVQAQVGAVSGLTYVEMTDWQAVIGSFAQPVISVGAFSEDLQRATRYYEKSYEYGTKPGTVTNNGMISGILAASVANGATIDCITPHFKVEKVITPTVVAYSPNSGASGNIFNQGGVDKAVTVTASKQGFIPSNNSGGGFGVAGTVPEMHWTADARL